jgi:hypothetical protein
MVLAFDIKRPYKKQALGVGRWALGEEQKLTLILSIFSSINPRLRWPLPYPKAQRPEPETRAA